MLAGRDRAKEEEERKEEKEEEPSRNPEVLESMDDALRNLLCRLGLSRAASSFEVEWYGSARTFIPDAWTHRRLLLEELEAVGRDSRLHREEVLEAEQILVRMQSEIRFRRLQQQKVWEQKRSLLRERRQLQEHLENSQEALRQLEEKHQAALRSKALLHLQRQRIQNLPEPDPIQEKPKEKLPPKSFCRRKNISRLWSPQEPPAETSFQLSSSTMDQQQLGAVGSAWSREKVRQKLLGGAAHSDWPSGMQLPPQQRLWREASISCCIKLGPIRKPNRLVQNIHP
ncbi:sperm-associated antigen 16 protein-like isoform X1 [Cyprinodon tularosa]|uniref:sperm-associated antigen 16 protein-like isoform X1 n=1 Tax=Cyprinodon tularosa TaxID=77115 RepID=UPI0018E1FA48|nr:sperm-associated antigen 16 protein-like isoform X1 [Cyprinodon tularosa]